MDEADPDPESEADPAPFWRLYRPPKGSYESIWVIEGFGMTQMNRILATHDFSQAETFSSWVSRKIIKRRPREK